MLTPSRSIGRQEVKHESTASEFISQTLRDSPKEVTILALGPLTNIALTMQLDPSVAQNVVGTLACQLCIQHQLAKSC